MAFRKRRRTFSKRRRGQPLARKRVTWFESYNNNLCPGPDVFAPCVQEVEGPCCQSLASLTLVNNDTLEQQFSDRLRVVRMIGNLWINVDYSDILIEATTIIHGAGYTLAQFNSVSLFMLSWLQTYMRVAISEVEVGRDDLGQQIWLGFNPMTPVTFSEGQWKRMWEHAWNPMQERNLSQTGPGVFMPTGCCPIIMGEYSAPNILDGTTVPFTETALDIQTDCQPCPGTPPVDGDIAGFNSTVKMPAWWHLSFDRKVSIPMRENNRLFLNLGWRMWNGSGVPAMLQPQVQVFGGIRSLLQF